jgi:sortase (surface protein transpeptidase)
MVVMVLIFSSRMFRIQKIKTAFWITLGIFLWLGVVVSISVPIAPYIWYRISPGAVYAQADVVGARVAEKIEVKQQARKLPQVDESLPKENGLIIPKIDVRTTIWEGDNYQEILQKGVWRVGDFGTPEASGIPMILAAHRFGYVWWTPTYRTLNSFYNLPSLEIGDKVNVIWNQRKYEYVIYKAEDGERITDYEADLVLYTCRLFNSPVRVFRYARMITQ